MSRPLSPALQKLITQFGQALPDKLAEIRALHGTDVNIDDDALQAYYTAVHRLAGSAGSYGFRAVSEAARVLDRYLSDVVAGETVYDPAKAQQQLDEMAKAVEQRKQEPLA